MKSLNLMTLTALLPREEIYIAHGYFSFTLALVCDECLKWLGDCIARALQMLHRTKHSSQTSAIELESL